MSEIYDLQKIEELFSLYVITVFAVPENDVSAVNDEIEGRVDDYQEVIRGHDVGRPRRESCPLSVQQVEHFI